MQNEEKILTYLQNIAAGIDNLDKKIDAVERTLNARIDEVERTLNARIDEVEQSLSARIDEVERTLNARIDEAEKSLNEKIDYSHDALLGLVSRNKENIELLLIPFSDRNLHIKSEVDKIPNIERRLDEVEIMVGNHSEVLRRLSYA